MNWRILLLTFLFGCSTAGNAPTQATPDPWSELRVMTFNIRYGSAKDGEHSWPHRRDRVEARIVDFAPDVLALQEALPFQLEELAEVLAGYRKVGQHREGGARGEFSGLYVRKELETSASGEFWFSQTPEVPGSKSWDSSLPRMCAWIELPARADGPALRIYGTHYDHRGTEARLEASRMIASHAQSAEAALIMGDLNATEEAPPLELLTGQGYRSAVLELHPGITAGTFSGFQGEAEQRRRIDHVLVRGPLEVLEASILGGRVRGLYPSDHAAVTAVVRPIRTEAPGSPE